MITYRTRSAVREVGKVFGLSDDTIGALASTTWGWTSEGVQEEHARRAGLDPKRGVVVGAIAKVQAVLKGFRRDEAQAASFPDSGRKEDGRRAVARAAIRAAAAAPPLRQQRPDQLSLIVAHS